MARMADPSEIGHASAPSGADASAGEELDALFPEWCVPLKREQVTVNEIGFVQGLRLAAYIGPIVKAIEEQVLTSGQIPGYDIIVGILGQHWDATLVLIRESTGLPATWFDDLTAADGELLLLTFWNRNAGFFYQRATNAVAVQQEVNHMLAGANSTQPSAPTDTATPSSAGTASES